MTYKQHLNNHTVTPCFILTTSGFKFTTPDPTSQHIHIISLPVTCIASLTCTLHCASSWVLCTLAKQCTRHPNVHTYHKATPSSSNQTPVLVFFSYLLLLFPCSSSPNECHSLPVPPQPLRCPSGMHVHPFQQMPFRNLCREQSWNSS